MKLPFLKQATKIHMRPGDDEWDIYLFFNIEKEVIDQELVTQASKQWRQLKSESAAVSQVDTLVKDITSAYDKDCDEVDSQIYKAAVRGDLKKQSPKNNSIFTMKVAFWIALIAEVTVMLVQQLFTGDFNPFIIVLAVLLGLGGFMQGLGIGKLLDNNWRKDTKRPLSGDSSGTIWLLIGIGSALILLISAVRSAGGSSPLQFALVFLVTLLFGEAVAICEALKVKYSSMRNVLLEEMEQAQRWQAHMSHHDLIMRGVYRDAYVASVKRCSQIGPADVLASTEDQGVHPAPIPS